jgi:hypothetical protein
MKAISADIDESAWRMEEAAVAMTRHRLVNRPRARQNYYKRQCRRQDISGPSEASAGVCVRERARFVLWLMSSLLSFSGATRRLLSLTRTALSWARACLGVMGGQVYSSDWPIERQSSAYSEVI